LIPAQHRKSCFLCGGPGREFAREKFWNDFEFRISWCDSCRVGWVVDLPSGEVFVEGYERWNVLGWKHRTQESIQRDVRRAYLKGYRVGAEFRRRGPVASTARVLEVGSNIGAVLKGCSDSLGLPSHQLRFSDVENSSLVDQFEDSTIDAAIASARRVARFKHFFHAWLRLHFPWWLPFGGEMEAFVRRSSHSPGDCSSTP
jgi:hypothetical protein